MPAAIYLDHLDFGWDRSESLLSIDSFRIERSEKIFLQGESGSGKTTLLNLIGGVLEPRSGSVHILDSSLNDMDKTGRDRFRADHIGFIFQMFNLLPYLNVMDNVTLPCQFSNIRQRRAVQRDGSVHESAGRLLSHLELGDQKLLSRRITDLSMGQQQRVAVARALIGSPEILVADEPTSSLDAHNRDRFLELLLSECEEQNITLMFVSHDPGLKGHFGRVMDLKDINQAGGNR